MEERVFIARGGEVESFELKYNADLLALYVVFQAIKDLRESRELLASAKTKKMRTSLSRIIQDCERFFSSARCEELCGIDGKVILDHLDDIQLPAGF